MGEKYQKLLNRIKEIKGFDTLDQAQDWYADWKAIRSDQGNSLGSPSATEMSYEELSSLIKNNDSKKKSKKAIKAKRKVV